MKLLFVNNNMAIGGIQKALVNMLKAISDKHDVTLLLMNPSGALMKEIPDSVKLIRSNRFTEIMGMSNAEAKQKGIFTFIWKSLWTVFTRIFGTKYTYMLLTRFQKIPGEYDAAISYMHNSGYRIFYGGCNEFVLNSVKAKEKITFVHCDFKNYIGNNAYNRSLYNRFDRIACVSDSCRRVFLGVCPEYKKKTLTVHNFHDVSYIKSQADEYMPKLSDDSFNIFTSARISPEKGILRVIPIIAKLKNEGFNIKWYIAGSGEEEAEARALSNELGADVAFLGMLDNPYPYFKHAHLLLVPSYNEAAPMVYAEAAVLGTPILTTDTTSANELVASTGTGIVCENNDKSIEDSLRHIIVCREEIPVFDEKGDSLNHLAASELEICLKMR